MQLLTVTQYLTILKNKKEVTEHLKNDKDFLIRDYGNLWDNKPCNKSDLLREKYTHIKVYYGKNNAKMTVIEL
mgnify:CR=1 FL=1